MAEKSSSLSLVHLPPEILSHIVSFSSSSFIILKLWKSGDALIRSKLAAGAQHVYFKDSSSFCFPMPVLITELRTIRSLRLHFAKKVVSESSQWLSLLLPLPATLETLELLVSNKSVPLPLEACVPASALLPPTHDSSMPSTTSGSGPLINLARRFPRLTRLVIPHETALECFPATLTFLGSSRSKIDCTKSPIYASRLPPSLTELNLVIEYKDFALEHLALIADDWQRAPPHLTRMSYLTFSPTTPTSFAFAP